MIVYRGERRYLSIEMGGVLADGDTLTGAPIVEVAGTELVQASPAPAIDGASVRFWIEVPADDRQKLRRIRVQCGTVGGETVVATAPLAIQ